MEGRKLLGCVYAGCPQARLNPGNRAMLEKLCFVDLEFFLRFEKPATISPSMAGSMLRGAFGSQLRRIVCFDTRTRCLDCQMRLNCAYEKIFAPHVSPAAHRLRKERDLPRGFVLKPPLSGAVYGPERLFAFRMILVGELIGWFPYIVVPFNELGQVGIGRDRTPFQLEQIVSLGLNQGPRAHIYSKAENLVHADRMIRVGFNDLARRAQPMNKEAVTLKFLTPTVLRYNATGRPGESETIRVPEFHVLIKRLRDRVNRLATVYCGEELSIDYRAFGERAEKVKTEKVNGRWTERARKTRDGRAHNLSGFTGEVSFTGPTGEFLPLILLGQYIHAGKNAVFGNGWYEVLYDRC